jgi:hypothetical protein
MAPINLPDGSQVSEIVLPNGATASEVIAPDGSTVFSAIPDSAITHYDMEDTDDISTLNDRWGGNDATLNGSPTYTTDAAFGSNAIEFVSADSDWAATGITGVPSGAWSIFFAFKFPSSSTKDYLCSNEGSSFDGFSIRYNNSELNLRAGNGTDAFSSVSASVNESQYYTTALTYDGSGGFEGYLDGSSLGTFSVSFTDSGSEIAINNISGSRTNAESDIIIDHWKLFDKELTATEVSDLDSTGSI